MMYQLQGLRMACGPCASSCAAMPTPTTASPRGPTIAPHRGAARRRHMTPPSSNRNNDLPVTQTNPIPDVVPAPALDAAADPASLLGTAWDPEGLFQKAAPLNFSTGEQMGDLIARRERERAARRAAASTTTAVSSTAATSPPTDAPIAVPTPSPPTQPPLPAGYRPIRPLLCPSPTASTTASDSNLGFWPQDLPAEVVSEAAALLEQDFMPVDLGWPGVRLLHLDPPVLTVDGFLSGEQCDAMVQQAEVSGRMAASRIGASNVAASYGNNSSSRRTSTGMMITPGAAGPVMDAVVSELQARGKQLLRAAEGPAWGPPGKLPRSRQYCYESIQMARYETGQHFLAHEDGFPPAVAAGNGFQRHATLLVYLNDVPEGGATRFDYLGLAVRPQKGKALLFFPAFSDGKSDLRSLHTAEAAVHTKYVTQQWIARGLPQPTAAKPQQQVATEQQQQIAQQEAELEKRERGGRLGKAEKSSAKAGKGFGMKSRK